LCAVQTTKDPNWLPGRVGENERCKVHVAEGASDVPHPLAPLAETVNSPNANMRVRLTLSVELEFVRITVRWPPGRSLLAVPTVVSGNETLDVLADAYL
jgi:hypothetical protein